MAKSLCALAGSVRSVQGEKTAAAATSNAAGLRRVQSGERHAAAGRVTLTAMFGNRSCRRSSVSTTRVSATGSLVSGGADSRAERPRVLLRMAIWLAKPR